MATLATDNSSPGTITSLIQPEHLTPQRMAEYRGQFVRANGALHVVRIDNFLVDPVARAATAFLLSDAVRYETRYALYSTAPDEASLPSWLEAPQSDRFYRYQVATRIASSDAALGLAELIQVQLLLRSYACCALAERISGMRLEPGRPFTIHRMNEGDFLGSHTDTIHGRRLAVVLNLSVGPWASSAGGALCLFDPTTGAELQVEPVWNSLLLFDLVDVGHEVSELRPWRGYNPRLTLTGWYNDRGYGASGVERRPSAEQIARCTGVRIWRQSTT